MNTARLSKDELDAVVICGMAARLPGGVATTGDLWQLMVEKRSGLKPIPPERFNRDGFYSRHPRSGTIQNRDCYMLGREVDLTKFDASHFTSGRREIEAMDPMQRQLLEIARECLESAGEKGTFGTKVGCFVGSFTSDWQDDLSMDPHHTGLYRGSGHLDFLQPNRISYEYGWNGPSMLIRTGCSSSLVALHQAAEAVRRGTCTSAMALGVNLITSANMSVNFTNAGLLSPSGKCKTFDLSADGYGRGEAVNAVFVKTLRDALRDGNPIRAVIRASGTNNDGRAKGGIMCPDAGAQEALIRQTYAQAGIENNFGGTAFFECHGTATATGDPLELTAVGNIWKDHGGIMVGANEVKPNVGHSEGAAGLTSVIKAVLAIEHRVIPPNIYFNTPNPKIPWKKAGLSVPTAPQKWPQDRKERVSVNSFGVSGSNAHMILESSREFLERGKLESESSCPPFVSWSDSEEDSGVSVSSSEHPTSRLLLFSATHMDSLQATVERHREYLSSKPPSRLDDVAYTLAHHRDTFNCRGYAIAGREGEQFIVGNFKRLPTTTTTNTASPPRRRVVFVYTGQGVSWPGMARSLLQQENKLEGGQRGVFARSIEKLDFWLQSLPVAYRPAWTLEQELIKDDESSRVCESGYSQPCSTAVQIALTDYLHSLGVYPDAVTAHSLGEAAAAYAVGALTANQAMAVAFFRGLVLTQRHKYVDETGINNPFNTGVGCMAALSLGAHEIRPYLLPGAVVGCENSHSSTTISGDPGCIQHVIDQVQRRHPGVKATLLKVDMPYHSPSLEPLAAPYEELLKPYLQEEDIKSPSVPLYSSVTGAKIDRQRESFLLGPRYWRDSFVQPVLFTQAMAAFAEDQDAGPNEGSSGTAGTVFVEIGGHPALRGAIQENLQLYPRLANSYDHVPTLTRGGQQDGCVSLLRIAGDLVIQGVPVDLATVVPETGRTLTDLPSYAWHHEGPSYTNEPRNAVRHKHQRFARHELLGSRVLEGNDLEPAWRNMLDLTEVPWLQDHVVGERVLMPAAAFVAMAGAAIRQVSGSSYPNTGPGVGCGYSVKDMRITAALPLTLDAPKVEIMTRLIPEEDKDSDGHLWYDFRIMSCSGSGSSHWTSHARGFIRRGAESDAEAVPGSSQAAYKAYPRAVDHQRWYKSVKEVIGIDWGAAFQGTEDITANPVVQEASGTVYDFEDYDEADYVAHPTVLDQLLQICLVAMTNGLRRNLDRTSLPTSIGRLSVMGAQDLRMRVYGTTHDHDNDNDLPTTAWSALFSEDDDGRPTAFVDGLGFSELPTGNKPDEVPVASFFAWDADVTMTDNLDDLLEGSGQVTTESQPVPVVPEHHHNSHLDHVARLVGLLGWKMPDCHVLEIGTGNEAITIAAHMALAPSPIRRHYSQYTYACVDPDPDRMHHISSSLQDAALFNINVEGIEGVSLCTGADIVILPVDVLLTSSQDEVVRDQLEGLKDCLTPNGRILVYSSSAAAAASSDPRPDGDDLAQMVAEASRELEELGFTTESCANSHGMLVARHHDECGGARSTRHPAGVDEDDIVIMASDSTRGRHLAHLIRDYFGERGTSVGVQLSGRATVPSSAGKAGGVVMSLLDLEADACTAYNLTQDTFREFIDSLCDFHGPLVWVLPLVHTAGCTDPKPAMIQGALRTLHLENRTDVTLVEMDETSVASGRLFTESLWKVFRSLAGRTTKGRKLDPDYDYAVVGGRIQVPRMQWFRFKDPGISPPAGACIPTTSLQQTSAAVLFRRDVSYLLVGGLGGLGRSVATWMLEHGASSLVFLSPSAEDEKHQPFIRELEAYPGSVITMVAGDVSREDHVKMAYAKAPTPIAGIMQLSLILRDNATRDMTFSEWQEVIRPRVDGTLHLDRASSAPGLRPLDFFLIFGSGVCHTGFFGQANYGASNTFLNAFVAHRHHRNLAASIVDIGAVGGDIGYVAARQKVLDSFTTGGYYVLEEREVLAAVAVALANSRPGVSPLPNICIGGLTTRPMSDPANRVTWKRDVRFGASHHFYHGYDPSSSSLNLSGGGVGVDGQVRQVDNPAAEYLSLARTEPARLRDPATIARLATFIAGGLGSLMLKAEEEVSTTADLGAIGLDSIIAIELVGWLHQTLHVGLVSAEILTCGSLVHLAEKVADDLCCSA